ncbi:NAD(P)/FAD-dependent oxidoreductase [Saccharopolyspora sp. 5N708]|uniref:NAD(P)/FAD-dependent oxidoreductase n=1 Tax=Saccharopolyspora sp. 5N708 TaxID=3457424 RepID=UPI003FD2B132
MIRRVVVVGASVGGAAAVRGLRSRGFDGEITVISADPHLPHDKPPLSKQLLAGAFDAEQISLLDAETLAGIDLRRGVAATGLDVGRREVLLDGGGRVGYDALIIATGARARTLPGEPIPGVHVLRSLADATALRADLLRGGPLAVVGGGFVGGEVAATARGLGVPTTIVEALPTPFFRAVGPVVGELLAELHEAHEVGLLTGVRVAGFERGRDSVRAVVLEGGARVEASVVVVGVGVTPNTEWLAGSPVLVDDGVVCDEHGAVRGAAHVYAVGDVARWADPRDGAHHRVEHWTTANEHGDLVAHNLLAEPGARRAHTDVPYFWSDQHGLKIQLVGRVGAEDHVELRRAGNRTIALYSAAGQLTAAVTLGWPRALATCRRLLREGADLAAALAALEPAEAIERQRERVN